MFHRALPEFQVSLAANHEEQPMEETTRCVCGLQDVQSEDLDSGSLYIQCDHCFVWQHGFCVGFTDEKEIPDIYYCEICRPDLHHITYKQKAPPSSKYCPSAEHTQSSTGLRYFSSKKKWIVNSKNTTEVQSLDFSEKIVEKASSEPITSTEKAKEHTRKGKRRRNSDLPELSIVCSNHETKRIRTLSVSPLMPLNVQSSDSEEEQSMATIKKRKKEINTAIDTRNVSVKGRQNENKNKGKVNEKKTKTLDANLDIMPNSAKLKQTLSKTNAQNNINQTTDTDQKNRPKTKSRKTSSNLRHQHDTRHAQFQKDLEEQTVSNAINIIDKPSRPRIPQAKITMTEMKKRVAAILEYIGRTQLEMASNEEHRKKLFVPLLEKLDKEIIDKKENFPEPLHKKKLMNSSEDNKNNIVETSETKTTNNDIFDYNFDSFEMMENLTKQLLEWEEKFGSYKEKNS
ncbi:hypothetical protein PORY_002000 [Pneumocystis oryctolagi]|uniref:Uncharacterized protein n=1 Tax=Pneumocystis oryctolagi TaxID=42067 RepID=A0ACB7CA55_9ASCO|nr:hypothetical protein PORY_002000 [Pneumocystis oryctolagi]